MLEISKKQKIILIFLGIVAIIGIAYYSYVSSKEENLNVSNTNELEVENSSNEVDVEAEENKIKVHISGAVKNEGVYELEGDARIIDAIEKAGGTLEIADMKNVNLASKLEDGMKIYIPKQGEEVTNNNQEIEENIALENTPKENSKGKININKASKEELDTLPGIGESTAEKIINYRKEHKSFKSIEELKEVKGIGDAKFEEIKDFVDIK